MFVTGKICYTVLYTTLILVSVLCPAYLTSVPNKDREGRQLVLGGLAAYAGIAVTEAVYSYLLAAFGVAAVTAAGVTVVHAVNSNHHDSHPCYGNIGWCRPTCEIHERIDGIHSDVCGSFWCCVSNI